MSLVHDTPILYTQILSFNRKREYKKLAFFSLDRNQKAAEVFEKGGTTADILMALSAISQVDITPNKCQSRRFRTGHPMADRCRTGI